MRDGIITAVALGASLLAAGCGAPYVQVQAAEVTQDTAWFVEVRGGNDVRYVVCHPEGNPPCMRFRAKDAEGLASLQGWIR